MQVWRPQVHMVCVVMRVRDANCPCLSPYCASRDFSSPLKIQVCNYVIGQYCLNHSTTDAACTSNIGTAVATSVSSSAACAANYNYNQYSTYGNPCKGCGTIQAPIGGETVCGAEQAVNWGGFSGVCQPSFAASNAYRLCAQNAFTHCTVGLATNQSYWAGDAGCVAILRSAVVLELDR